MLRNTLPYNAKTRRARCASAGSRYCSDLYLAVTVCQAVAPLANARGTRFSEARLIFISLRLANIAGGGYHTHTTHTTHTTYATYTTYTTYTTDTRTSLPVTTA